MNDEYGYSQQQTYQPPQGGYSQGYGQSSYIPPQGSYAPPPPVSPNHNYGMAVNQPIKGSGWISLLRVTSWILGILMWIGGIGVFMQAYENAQALNYFSGESSSAIMSAGIGSLLAFVLFGLVVISAGNVAANHAKTSQQIAANTNYLINLSLQNKQ